MMLILDLDGTLVDCNSFTEFVKFLFRRFPQLRWRIAIIVLKRKLRLITHHSAKEQIVVLAEEYVSGKTMEDFIRLLRGHLRPELVEMIDRSDRTILATAAPSIYAVPIASMLGIEEVCATEPGQGENNGARKLKSVERLGAEFDKDTVVVTDHYDDIPLLQRNARGRNILIEPDSTTVMHLRVAGIPFTISR